MATSITAGESAFVVQVEETSWDGRPKIRCLGCGQARPARPRRQRPPRRGRHQSWLCDDCVAHRRQYPTTDSEYLIEKRIGGGGMGEVFLARHLPTNQPVAIKMMVPSIAASDRAKLRFQRELDVLKNLRHPNIVAFHTMFELDGQFQLVMEYVVGKDAHEWVKSLPGACSRPRPAPGSACN